MFKRFFLVLLALTVSLGAFTVLFSETSKAVSPYDNLIKVADPPYQVKSFYGTYQRNFASAEELGNQLALNYELWLSNTSGYCQPAASTSTAMSAFLRMIQDGHSYAAFQLRPSSTNDNGIAFMVDTNPVSDTELIWSTSGVVLISPTPTIIDFYISMRETGDIALCGFQTGTSGRDSFNYSDAGNNGQTAIIESTFPFNNVPDGYEGLTPPGEPSSNKDRMYPLVGYTITDDNVLNALSAGIFEEICVPVGDPTSGCAKPQIRWQVLDQDNEVLKTYTNAMANPFTFQFPTIGTFYLEATYVLPPPFLAPSPNVELTTVRIEMQPNGTFQKGGTGANECSFQDGKYICEPASPFEDCSTYGGVFPFGLAGVGEPADVIGGFSCIINNFGIFLRNTLINLFVPDSKKLQTTLDSFSQSLQSQFGFVYTGFVMVVQWLNAILTINPQCNFDMGPATFFGARISVNFCYFEQTVPTIYNLLIGLARLILAASFVFVAYRRLREIVESLGTR